MDGENSKWDFTTEGLSMLQERLREKLRELMEDYTDESLVDYVIVLLKNGRSKEDTIKELHVFLGDQSTSFISWLWEHLSLNSHLYVTNSSRRSKPSTDDSTVKMETDTNASRREGRRDRPKRDPQEIFPLRSMFTHILHGEERNNKQSSSSILKQCDSSSKTHDVKKRLREEDEQPPRKRGAFIDVSRRLLQSAVRDAVKTVPPVHKPSNSIEPMSSQQRLRSVVLTSSSPKEKNSSENAAAADRKPRKTRSSLNASGSFVAVKAAAEAAAESTSNNKPRNSSRSVFDRLTTRTAALEEREKNVDFDRFEGSKNHDHEMDELDGEKEIIAHESNFAIDESLEEDDDVAKEMSPEQDLVIVASSDDVREEPPSVCETLDDVGEMEGPVSGEKENNTSAMMPKVEEETCITDIKEENADAAPKESQKTSSIQVHTSHATLHPPDDVDSRTVIVSNVNFAATKDALSRHFNKFGAVLKVLLINDPTTGQPTGSAYVEFLNKESAELALSVNGTSFMSRIVKVVKRNSHEAAQFLGWARGGRVGSSFGMYPRGIGFRGRPPVKAGARSLQWKRGTSSTIQPPVASTNSDAN